MNRPIVKKYVLACVLVMLALFLSPARAQAQGCSVSGISLASTGTSSSNCYVPPGQGILYAVTGTWAGTTSVYYSENNGLSWVLYQSFTANQSAVISPASANRLYRVTFDSRTSGTVTGNLLGLNPVPGLRIYETVPSLIGPVAYSSLGTATTYVQYTDYITSVNVPRNMTVTTIGILNGGTVGTDKVVYALYDGSGQLLGNTLATGTTTSGGNAFQEIALTTNLTIPAGLYYIGVTADTGTDNIRLTAASTVVSQMSTSATGTAVAPPAVITVPTTFTATKGPIGYVKGF